MNQTKYVVFCFIFSILIFNTKSLCVSIWAGERLRLLVVIGTMLRLILKEMCVLNSIIEIKSIKSNLKRFGIYQKGI